MNDPPPILPYATGTGSLSSESDRFVFRAPPFVVPLVFNSLVACFFASAAIKIAMDLAWAPGPIRWDGALFILLLLFGPCAAFGWQHWNRAARILRFAGLPITINIADGQLILIDPPQWGLKVESVLLYDLERIESGLGGWSLLGPTRCRVKLYRRDDVPLEMHVHTSDAAGAQDAVAAITARLPSRPRHG